MRLALEAHDIESRPTWKPLHLQPAFAGVGLVGLGRCADIFDHGLCLPTGSALTPADQSRVISEIVSAHGQRLTRGEERGDEDPHRRLGFPLAAGPRWATSGWRRPSRPSPTWERRISLPSTTTAGRRPPSRDASGQAVSRQWCTVGPAASSVGGWHGWPDEGSLSRSLMQSTDNGPRLEFEAWVSDSVRPRVVRQGCHVRVDGSPATRSDDHRSARPRGREGAIERARIVASRSLTPGAASAR